MLGGFDPIYIPTEAHFSSIVRRMTLTNDKNEPKSLEF